MKIKILYKGDQIGLRKVDFLVEKIIPVEIKTITELTNTNLLNQKIILKMANRNRAIIKFWCAESTIQKVNQ